MELKKVQQDWNRFPEVSMEERPILSPDLEKIVVTNPLAGAFYLKPRIHGRILIAGVLWFLNIYQWRTEFKTNGNDLYQQAALFFVLSYFIYFHIRLLLFADYPSLLSLKLIPFLHKIETVLDKYVLSFGIISVLAGFYLLALFEKTLSWLNSAAYAHISENGFYKWLIIIFLSISFYILFLQSVIPKYKRLLTAVRSYREEIGAKSQKK
ncbi:MAG TPA: hypothetical protein VF939_14445 [Puia sp.]